MKYSVRFVNAIHKAREFGILFIISQVWLAFLKKFKNRKFSLLNRELKSAFYFEQKIILSYLKKDNTNIVSKYISEKNDVPITGNKVIWVYWNDDLESAPKIVQACVNSIKSNSGVQNIRVIDFISVQQYIDIPDSLLKKVSSGFVSQALFTDYLRFKLLYNYGGVWLDATCFCTDKIPNSVFLSQIYSVKNLNGFNFDGIGEYQFLDIKKWTSYFVAGQKGGLFSKYMYESLEDYINRHDILIHYHLVFYYAKIAREVIPIFREEYSQIEDNNASVELLAPLLNESYFSSNVQLVLSDNSNWFYKLTYKNNFIADNDSLYNVVLKKYIGDKNGN